MLEHLQLLGKFNNPRALPVLLVIFAAAFTLSLLLYYLMHRLGWNRYLASAISVAVFFATIACGVVGAWFSVPNLVR